MTTTQAISALAVGTLYTLAGFVYLGYELERGDKDLSPFDLVFWPLCIAIRTGQLIGKKLSARRHSTPKS